MPRGTTLLNLRNALKGEMETSFSASNIGDDVNLNLALRNRQYLYALEFDWPFLTQQWDLQLVGGTWFYQLPTQTVPVNGISETADINFERPVDVAVLYNEVYLPVSFGITFQDYNIANPAINLGSPMDPVAKYDLRSNVDETSEAPNMIEVWPAPASNYPMRFEGKRQVYDLFPPSAISAYLNNTGNYLGSGQNARDYLDAQKCDLDDLLLIHTVAAEKLAALGKKNADVQQAMAKERLLKLRATSPASSEPIIYGAGRLAARKKLLPFTVQPSVLIHG